MKRILYIMLLTIGMIFSSNIKAQNYIGYSFYDIQSQMNLKGFAVESGRTEHNTKYIMATATDQVRLYYFNEQNICLRYVYSVSGITYDMINTVLRNNGYVRRSDGKYYTSQYVATVEYHSTYKEWYVTTDPIN